MKIRKKSVLLILILGVAFVLRVWRLGENPPHLTPDEAALGYNAYSILKTGRDEYGELLPLVFKSFGDYKPGLYVYAAAPSVAIFGLNEFAVRLPSAIAGVVAVYLLFLIVEELFGLLNPRLKYIAGLMFAISSWHIHFSRGAWEVNLALTFTLAGVLFFLKSMKKPKYLFFSALFFGLSLLSYQGAKLSSTIVLLILAGLYLKKIFRFNKKLVVSSVIVGFAVCLPVVLTLFTGRAGRLKVFSVLSYRRPVEYLENQLAQGGEKVGDLTYYLFHSEALNISRGIMGRWFNHYSGRFLFFEGDWQNPRHSATNHGVLLLADGLFLVIGVFALFKVKDKKVKWFVFLWLLLSPLPSALSRDQVHAVRAFNMVIPYVILASLGVSVFWKKSILVKAATFGLYGLSFVYFLDAYFVHLPVHDSAYWEYGYKQAVEVVSKNKSRYEKVHFRQSFAQPYIYFLFYSKYPPQDYQKQANLIESEYGDVGRVEKTDNVYFLPIDWSVNRGDAGTLFVADPVRIPPEDSEDGDEFEVIAEIKYLDGKSVSQRVVGVKK